MRCTAFHLIRRSSAFLVAIFLIAFADESFSISIGDSIDSVEGTLSNLSDKILSDNDENSFNDEKIRVIRPRYFNKRDSFEIGFESTVVANYDFVYVIMSAFQLTYHFTEKAGIEFIVSQGTQVDKDDKRILNKDFGMQMAVFSIADQFLAAFVWTPVYGKFQDSWGGVYYFDTFVAGGGGFSGMYYPHDDCAVSGFAPTPPSTSYDGTVYGAVGERFFMNRYISMNLRLDIQGVLVNNADTACAGTVASNTLGFKQNINFSIGFSVFL